MPLGIEQNNHLSNLTLDVWRDQIFFSKKGHKGRRPRGVPAAPNSKKESDV